MDWDWAALVIADVLALALVIRLLSLRLHRVYNVFSLFVAYQIFASIVAGFLYTSHVYRIVWLCLSALGWALTLWTMYVLLDAVLGHLPGILRFSRWILHCAFVVGIGVALISSYGVLLPSLRTLDLNSAVAVALVIERAIASIAAIAAIGTVLFVLWFPVQMPRNLALFVVGLVFDLSVRAASLYVYACQSYAGARIANIVSTVVLAGCYGYWLASIRPERETQSVVWGGNWSQRDNAELISQLENMNTALWRSARR